MLLKKFFKYLPSIFIILLLIINITQWAEDTNIENEINYKKNIEIWNNLVIDITEIKNNLEEKFWERISVEWTIKWWEKELWNIFEKNFENTWDKEINLSIYRWNTNNKNIIIEKDINIFVYKKSSILLFDSAIDKNEIINIENLAKESWIYINKIEINSKDINSSKILENIVKYQKTTITPSTYVSVWWGKEFLLNVLSKLNKEISLSSYDNKINFILVSSFNIDVLKNFLNNFISNKTWINEIIMINETSKFQIIKYPTSIKLLKEELIANEFNFIELNPNIQINNALFISKFINNLSLKWFETKDIYLLLIIPFLLTWISIFKHLIWLSPLWITIPIFIVLLFFKLWLIPSFILLFIIFLLNLLLAKLLNRYTLLYTPKMSFISIINILVIIITINLMYNYNIISIDIENSIFIILLIIISERLISIILSKEFIEYRTNLVNTLIFCLITYLFFNINIVDTFLLAFPEIIMILIPINFMIWRFTWLRITEYFRFKEVIKNIEE